MGLIQSLNVIKSRLNRKKLLHLPIFENVNKFSEIKRFAEFITLIMRLLLICGLKASYGHTSDSIDGEES